MFTGLVEETGALLAFTQLPGGVTRLQISVALVTSDCHLGDSIAVNGCCLTAVEIVPGHSLSFDLLEETLRRTNLGDLAPGAPVNLERALAATARLGGHFVQGHIDTASEVLSFERPHETAADYRLEVALPPEYAAYVIEKGSICIDGISLTIAELHEHSIVAWIIPHTLTQTNLHATRPGARVNLEFDLLAKYVQRTLSLEHRERKPLPPA